MPSSRSLRLRTGLVIPALGALTATLLAGCAGSAAPTAPATTSAASPAPSVTLAPGEEVTPTAAPQYRPDGTAAQNLQYFTAVIERFRSGHDWGYASRTVVAALSAAGFAAGDIEITDSTTPNGYHAVSIETSVRIGEDCLVATLRSKRATVDLVPVLPSGRCLPSSH